MSVAKKCSGILFQQAWTESFGVIERIMKALCILCAEISVFVYFFYDKRC